MYAQAAMEMDWNCRRSSGHGMPGSY